MRLFSALLALVWVLSFATAKDVSPLRGTIVSMAQHFVQEYYVHSEAGHYHIEFDVAYLHPQPQNDLWAVVGGFVSDQNTSNVYVAALRQICSEFTRVACWRLEKLAINEKIVLNRGDPI